MFQPGDKVKVVRLLDFVPNDFPVSIGDRGKVEKVYTDEHGESLGYPYVVRFPGIQAGLEFLEGELEYVG